MKFYNRYPTDAIEGMRELTLEQVGAYNLILDLLYARDGVLPNDDVMVARLLYRGVRVWRRLKSELMKAGKIRVINDGLLMANGVQRHLVTAQKRSELARISVTHRWDRYKLAKQFNDQSIRTQYEKDTSRARAIYSSTSLEVEAYTEPGESSNQAEAQTTTASVAPAEPPQQVADEGGHRDDRAKEPAAAPSAVAPREPAKTIRTSDHSKALLISQSRRNDAVMPGGPTAVDPKSYLTTRNDGTTVIKTSPELKAILRASETKR